MSISFDRAAGYYDATRALPQQQADDLADLLAAEVGNGRCLEIGVGTGRIALPLHSRGVRIVGADLSAPMLGQLREKTGGQAPFPILVADATRLPFKAGSYDALLASHVFHLIPDWQQAAEEALRVVKRGGSLLVDFGGGTETPWRPLLTEIFRDHGIERIRPGVSDPEQVAAYFGDRVRMRPLPPLTLTTPHTLGKDLDLLEKQILSWTWPYSPEQMRAATEDARGRAAAAGYDLQEEVELGYTLQWWVYDAEAI